MLKPFCIKRKERKERERGVDGVREIETDTHIHTQTHRHIETLSHTETEREMGGGQKNAKENCTPMHLSQVIHYSFVND